MTPPIHEDKREIKVAPLSHGAATLADILADLAAILPGLKAAIENKPPIARMAMRLDEVADALGMSRRAIERERSAGRFPKPDGKVGKCPIWKPATIEAWLDSPKVVKR